MRTPLTPDSIISLRDGDVVRKYHIDQIIGQGSSCIVYEAHPADGSGTVQNVRIKECYPVFADIKRNGQTLYWADEAIKQDAFGRYRTSVDLITSLRNDPNVGNSITGSSLWEGNGTLYTVMELNHASIYDAAHTMKLPEIFDTIRVLTDVIGSIHARGYLHLDIKPDNFLVTHNPNTNIWLFDVDSLISQEDLKNRDIPYLSYTKEWAAPEVLCSQFGKIAPSADLYSIGAVLFFMTMGRHVSNEDIGPYTDWEFDDTIFGAVNPKVQRLLRDVFHHTISASIKRRYKTASELSDMLKQLYDAANEQVYILSSTVTNTTMFLGRSAEIASVHNAFSGGTNAVFLHGEGGIGKSSLAIAYGAAHKADYDAVVFLKYSNSLEDLMGSVSIAHCPDDEHSRTLKRLLTDRVLLIIDNFDVEIDEDEYLYDVLQCGAKVLFTTRTDFSSVLNGCCQIELGPLPYEQLSYLFTSISGIDLTDDKTQATFQKLLQKTLCNTFFIELLARQIRVSHCSLEQLWTKISAGMNVLSASEKVRAQKDGRIMKRTIPDILRVMFDVAGLSEERKQALRNLFLLRFLVITGDTYTRFTGAPTLDVLNDLVELGWVKFRYIEFSLHPLIEDLINIDLTPDEKNCPAVYEQIRQLIREHEEYEYDSEAGEMILQNKTQMLCMFFAKCDMHLSANRALAIDWLRKIIDHEYIEFGTRSDIYFKALLDKLLLVSAYPELKPIERCHLHFFDFYSHINDYRSIDVSSVARVKAAESRKQMITHSFDRLISCIRELPTAEQEPLLQSYITKASYHLNWYEPSDLPDGFVQTLCQISPFLLFEMVSQGQAEFRIASDRGGTGRTCPTGSLRHAIQTGRMVYPPNRAE